MNNTKTKLKPISTVNVIETCDRSILSLRSWPDTPEGNKAAEELFAACHSENKCNECDGQLLEEAIENGVAYNDDDYDVLLFHSHL